ncbi:MAG: hypothetical protein WCO55_02560 [Candidatus Falkowbacteria bacterium]
MAKLNDIEKINYQISQEAKTQNIQDGLAEIYQDDEGKLVDVQKLQIKKKKNLWLRLLIWTVYLILTAALFGGAYYYFLASSKSSDLEISWSGNSAPMNGQAQTYTLTIKNTGRIYIKDVDLYATLPSNFELDNTQPARTDKQSWHWAKLSAGESVDIKITGRFYNLVGKSNLFIAEATYKPDNFSATFKKSSSMEAVVAQSGLVFDIIRPTNMLVGEKQTVVIKYHLADGSNIDNFRLTIDPSQQGNLELIQDQAFLDHVKIIKPWVWQAYQLSSQDREITVNFKILDKNDKLDNFKFRFDYWLPNNPSMLTAMYESTSTTSTESRLGSMEPAASSTATSSLDFRNNEDRFLPLAEENYDINIIKNDLNLLMIENGTDKDQSADFGQTMTYSINYANKGMDPLENIVISANLKGDLVDWKSFKDKFGGKVEGSVVSWTKNELPDLARLDKDAKGTIDFSVKIKDLDAFKETNSFKPLLKAYATFTNKKVGDVKQIVADVNARDQQASIIDNGGASGTANANLEHATSSENMSNVILTRINSDLQLDEKVLYYSLDNEALGFGPVPLEIGKTTTLRAFWKITNTLHNLSSVEVSVNLPQYVNIDGKPTATVGSLNYDPANHRLVWSISRLDKGSNEQSAQFNVAITPSDSLRNKILIIFPKTEISANDDESGSMIKKEVKARTSKFEDDLIVQQVVPDLNGGLVK